MLEDIIDGAVYNAIFALKDDSKNEVHDIFSLAISNLNLNKIYVNDNDLENSIKRLMKKDLIDKIPYEEWTFDQKAYEKIYLSPIFYYVKRDLTDEEIEKMKFPNYL